MRYFWPNHNEPVTGFSYDERLRENAMEPLLCTRHRKQEKESVTEDPDGLIPTEAIYIRWFHFHVSTV
jgi:hypothetical protein